MSTSTAVGVDALPDPFMLKINESLFNGKIK
jgi:hypothetical protein